MPFGGSESEPNLAFANVGVEGRYHFRPQSPWGPRVGAGVGVLLAAFGQATQSAPWLWPNAGVTLSPAPRLRLDLEASPVVAVSGHLPGKRLAVLPFVRLRWLF